MIYRTTKTIKRVNCIGQLRLKTGKLQMEVQNGKEYDWIKNRGIITTIYKYKDT